MYLGNVAWDDVLPGSLKQQWQGFKELIINKANHTSSKLIPKPKTLPVMAKEMKRVINHKSRYWKKYKQHQSLDYRKTYCNSQNKLKT